MEDGGLLKSVGFKRRPYIKNIETRPCSVPEPVLLLRIKSAEAIECHLAPS